MNPAFAIAEVFWILGGRRDAHFLSYFNRSLLKFSGSAAHFYGAYGYRLRRHFNVDQLEAAYETLRADSNSRQVVLQIWDPTTDLPLRDGRPRDADIPCNTQSILKVRDGKLEWVQIVRSNDVFLGLPHNVVQFTMLQEILAGWLQLELGHYHHVSDSLHAYEHDTFSDSTLSEGVPEVSDNLALERSESIRSISAMVQAIETIIDETQTVDEISRLPTRLSLPNSYRDLLRVLVAEGSRRRGDVSAANSVMDECKSKYLLELWTNWRARLKLGL